MTISYRNYSPILLLSSCLLVACTDSPSVTATGATESTSSDSKQSSSDGSTLPGTSTLITTTDPDITTTNDSEGSATSAGTVTTNETATTDETATDATTGTTTGPIADCNANDGEVDEACDLATPFCVSGECVSCKATPGDDHDSFCLKADSNTGACDLETGICIPCTQNALTACTNQGKNFCNPWIPQCEAKCTEHIQCPNSACDLNVGTCFPENSVVYVDKDNCQNGNGTLNSPFCTVNEALNKVYNNLANKGVIKILSAGTYDSVNIKPQSTIAILASEQPTLLFAESAPALEIAEKSNIYTQSLDFKSNGSIGARCSILNFSNASSVKFHNARFSDHSLYAIVGANCNIELNRSVVTKNFYGVALTQDGTLRVENSYLTENGKGQAGPPQRAIGVDGNVKVEIAWSTILRNNNGNAGGDSIFCKGLTTSAVIRNSIIIGEHDSSVVCGDLSITSSIIDFENLPNVYATQSDIDTWFTPVDGVYQIKQGSKLPKLALWTSIDPLIDFFKNLRATVGTQPPGAEHLSP